MADTGPGFWLAEQVLVDGWVDTPAAERWLDAGVRPAWLGHAVPSRLCGPPAHARVLAAESGDGGGGDDDEAPDGLEPTAEGGAELGEGEDEPWWGSHSPWLPSGVYAWHAPSRGTAEVALALPAPK